MRKISVLSLLLIGSATAAEPPTRAEAAAALARATAFYHGTVAAHGGYLYAYSADLTLREGEGIAGPDTVWVQPPGTPTVGEAFLDAHAATGDARQLAAAADAAGCLRRGQLFSGGWTYRIDFDPADRMAMAYRLDADGRPRPAADPGPGRSGAGWEEWKRRKTKGNLSTLDDDVTQAALRFLIRYDRATGFTDAGVRDAVEVGLTALLNGQYPNGGWSANWDRFPAGTPSEETYPVQAASYPASWPRVWPKDFTGCYVTNDDLIATTIDTLLRAADTYAATRPDTATRCRAAAERAGGFLLLARMPAPQPAWAQQYDRAMHPVWSRAFEPPAISGGESQRILETLLLLYRATGDRKYLDAVPEPLAYLRASRRPDGTLARFYELQTNRPLYFTRDRDGRHVMTDSDDNVATGYGYIIASRLDAIDAEYRRLLADGPGGPALPGRVAAKKAREAIDALDTRGAWVTPGRLRHHKTAPPGGVIDSAVFATRVRTLSRYSP